MWLEDLGGEIDPAGALAAEQDLRRGQIDAALRYRDAYPFLRRRAGDSP
jgi:hypothetical protein